MARILIADDDPDIRQLVIYALIDQGHEVSVAKDGKEAFDAVEQSPPDLMVLDIMMPEMDGYDVMRALNDKGIRGFTKILVLTAKGSERDWKLGYDLGADRYVTKPFDPDELVEIVTDMLSSSSEELAAKREEEQDRANLLSQLESIFGEG